MLSDSYSSSPAATPEDPALIAAQERVWVERIRHGDEAAFEAMFRAYYTALVGFAGRYLGRDREAARDIVHDVLFNVWLQRARWNVRGSVGTYLHGATRNRCVDYLRRQLIEDRWRRRLKSSGDDLNAIAIAGRIMPGADELTDADEIDRAIVRAVARLPARCREAFVLHWERGLTIPEIAHTMGTSPNTVRVQLGRALKALRQALVPFLLLLITLTSAVMPSA
jgi:RNA polymerase sigma-19 factor, ECF subfamily